MTLLLKLVLVPGLIALVTMAGRRFGPRIGGWLNALPLVAGPVLFFLALFYLLSGVLARLSFAMKRGGTPSAEPAEPSPSHD